ncbi:MAG: FAD-dependent oxidoreductase [Candidatus Pacearchaeota archaeon]
MIYDLIIIGAGPAGITAGIYAARRKINFLIISKNIGGQMSYSSDVENYPGFHFISGVDLTQKFKQNMRDYNINVKFEEVIDIVKKNKMFIVKTSENFYETYSVIIASGKSSKKLNVPGEDKFLGRGVSYCAICDAIFFKDKDVAVIGGRNSAFDACLILSKYARKIYLLDEAKKLSGEPFLRDKVLNDKKVTYISEVRIVEIFGDKNVNGIKFLKNKKYIDISVQGVFIEIGLIPNVSFAKIIEKNKNNEIKIKRTTKSFEENMTSVKGIFAAGDVTDVPSKQIIIAAGEGAKAALACFNYIDRIKTRINR